MHDAFDPGTGVEPTETRFQYGNVADQIRLGDQQSIGKRHLLHRFILMVELMNCIGGIHRRHDRIEPQEMRDQWIVQQQLHDRAGSARPVVSTRIRRNGGTSPRSRLTRSVRSVSSRSLRIVQQIQPLASTATSPSTRSTKRWSRLTSPYSLIMTALSSWRRGAARD